MTETTVAIGGNIVDILGETIEPGVVEVAGGRIVRIRREPGRRYDRYLLPGLVDSHVHIESSMLPPAEYARLASARGTVAVLADPHEIANVLGIAGVRYMVENGRQTPFKFYFGAPSCVPATGFETAGAGLGTAEIESLFREDGLKFLGEMMNYPGVLAGDPEVLARLAVARRYGRPVDGHAPGLRGPELMAYYGAGITTDHEAYTLEEGLEKAAAGMKVQIREGSAAKNFAALHPLIDRYPSQCMFCTDDRHPDELAEGHIDHLVKLALAAGHDRFKVLRCASANPVFHYGLEVGLLRPGDPADLIVIDDFERFTILATYIGGRLVAEAGASLLPRIPSRSINNFRIGPKAAPDFAVPARPGQLNVIEVYPGELITGRLRIEPAIAGGEAVADPGRDLLKIAVVNRYRDAVPALGFVKNFGLRKGAIASSVAHDSHNIVTVGATDRDLARAVNLIIEHQGGLAVVSDDFEAILPLPVAGLMSYEEGRTVAAQYRRMAARARELGSPLPDPFMTLSFMALLVIPELKLSDRGLFDAKRFAFTELFE